MKYKIDGAWGVIHRDNNINLVLAEALIRYREGHYYNTPKVFILSSYPFKEAYQLLLKMSPKNSVSIVRASIEGSNTVLVTLAILLTDLNQPWSNSGSMCLEELLEVLQDKDPEYHDFFINALSSGEVA